MTTRQEEQEESIASEVLAASLGGAVSASVLYPLEVLKTKMQADHDNDDKTSMVSYAKSLHEKEGPNVFFHGMEMSALQSATEKALYFFAYTLLKNAYRRTAQKEMSTMTRLVLGCMAEWAHLPITLPMDCWTSAIQTTSSGNHESAMQLLTSMLSEKGLVGMYKGISAYVVLCLKPALQYTVYEQLKARLVSKTSQSLTAAQAFLLGMIARTVSTICVFPYLRAKVLMQTSSQDDTSMMQLLKMTLRDGSLFRGLGPELTRGVLSSALMLMIKERIAVLVHAALYGKQ